MLSEPTQASHIKVKSTAIPITGGPSREELFDSLRLQTKVTFTTGSATRFEVVISALEREDGSGEIWNFKATALGRNDHPFCDMLGSYSSRTRNQGMIELAH